MSKRPDKFKRWMIASFFLIPLVIFGSVGVYYAYFPVKMRVLIRLLGYDRSHFWARQRIGQAGDRAIPYLIDGFASGNQRIRSESLSLLVTRYGHERYFGLEETVRHLVKSLRSKNANVRSGSAEAFPELVFWEVGASAIYPLDKPRPVDMLRDWAETLPSKAHFLQILRENRVVPELAKSLSDPETRVRALAASALGKIGDQSAIPDLIKALSDPEENVRRNASRALEQLSPLDARTDVIRIFGEPSPSDASWPASVSARLRQKVSVPHLIKLLSRPDGRVRKSAAAVLGALGAKEAAPDLIRLLADPDAEVRHSAAYALGEFKEESAVPGLIKLISGPDHRVRLQAMRALAKIGSEEAVAPLIASLRQVSETAVSYGYAQADESKRVSRQALLSDLALALEKITSESFGHINAATSEAQLQAIVQKWLDWWEENKEKYEVGEEDATIELITPARLWPTRTGGWRELHELEEAHQGRSRGRP